MKKILLMIDSLTCGGAEKSLISLLPFLAERDYEITLMVQKRGGLFEKYIPENVRLESFPFKPSNISSLLYSIYLRLPFIKRQHLAELYWKSIGNKLPRLAGEYDVAIAYQQGFPTFYIAEKVTAKNKICWVNVDVKNAGYSSHFCKPFYLKYNHVVTVSDILRDKIVFPDYVSDEEKIITCYDILNESLILSMAKGIIIRDISDRRIHITTVGRLVPPKGFDIAIDVAEILKNRGFDFIWHFVGGGPLYDQLMNLIEDRGLENNVILEGEQDNPYPYMAAADIYVQPSRFEGFGLTIGEAKILNKPIVSTNFPVVYDQITDGVNGLVVDMQSEAIAEGVMRLIKDKELRTHLIEALTMEHNTTAETESKKVIEIIESGS